MTFARFSTGVAGLDDLLGGGLLPGTLTVVVGGTGVGKTQLALQFANAGLRQEGRRGIVFDMTCRGDSQSHAAYSQRMFNWQLQPADAAGTASLENFFDAHRRHGDYLHVFDESGRRVTRHDLSFDDWHLWQAELARKLSRSIAFFYGNFTGGVGRAVIDGLEPAQRPSESIQFELFEYLYHQVLRKPSEWVARDLFRERYRAHAHQAAAARYDPDRIASMLVCTSRESMLDELLDRKLDEGDVLANANTVIYLGRTRQGHKLGRALYIAKHRGSPASEDITPFTVGDQGLVIARPAPDQ